MIARLLVRHAVAQPREGWEDHDDDRPLDERGREQAAGLVGVLAGFPVTRVLSSPAVRCVETVAPLAAARGLVVEPTEALAEGIGRQALELVLSLAGEAVILCSHGDVIPDILAALGPEGRAAAGSRCQKGSTWVLVDGEAKPRPWGYVLPPPPGP